MASAPARARESISPGPHASLGMSLSSSSLPSSPSLLPPLLSASRLPLFSPLLHHEPQGLFPPPSLAPGCPAHHRILPARALSLLLPVSARSGAAASATRVEASTGRQAQEDPRRYRAATAAARTAAPLRLPQDRQAPATSASTTAAAAAEAAAAATTATRSARATRPARTPVAADKRTTAPHPPTCCTSPRVPPALHGAPHPPRVCLDAHFISEKPRARARRRVRVSPSKRPSAPGRSLSARAQRGAGSGARPLASSLRGLGSRYADGSVLTGRGCSMGHGREADCSERGMDTGDRLAPGQLGRCLPPQTGRSRKARSPSLCPDEGRAAQPDATLWRIARSADAGRRPCAPTGVLPSPHRNKTFRNGHFVFPLASPPTPCPISRPKTRVSASLAHRAEVRNGVPVPACRS